jgi:hypothetical protein
MTIIVSCSSTFEIERLVKEKKISRSEAYRVGVIKLSQKYLDEEQEEGVTFYKTANAKLINHRDTLAKELNEIKEKYENAILEKNREIEQRRASKDDCEYVRQIPKSEIKPTGIRTPYGFTRTEVSDFESICEQKDKNG